MRDYTEASAHLAAQLPEDYSQVERAITYLTSLKPSIRAYLPVHQIPRTFNETADMALHIESNAELLGTGPAFADGPARRLEDDRSRSASPRKWEGSPSQGDRERDSEADRQQEGGHWSRRKDRSRVRLEERVQPALPQATPARLLRPVRLPRRRNSNPPDTLPVRHTRLYRRRRTDRQTGRRFSAMAAASMATREGCVEEEESRPVGLSRLASRLQPTWKKTPPSKVSVHPAG